MSLLTCASNIVATKEILATSAGTFDNVTLITSSSLLDVFVSLPVLLSPLCVTEPASSVVLL